MSSFCRTVRAGAGIGAAVAVAVILSACTGRQNSPAGGPAANAPTAATHDIAPAQATIIATTATSAPATNPAPAACASATKPALEAALKADKKASAALIVDGNGLQHIKCEAPWAFARFSNDIDGGAILFNHRNGTWVPQNWGTGELCENVPPAIAQKICVY